MAQVLLNTSTKIHIFIWIEKPVSKCLSGETGYKYLEVLKKKFYINYYFQ